MVSTEAKKHYICENTKLLPLDDRRDIARLLYRLELFNSISFTSNGARINLDVVPEFAISTIYTSVKHKRDKGEN